MGNGRFLGRFLGHSMQKTYMINTLTSVVLAIKEEHDPLLYEQKVRTTQNDWTRKMDSTILNMTHLAVSSARQA